MTGEIRNPAKLPTDLNPAEKEFARCLAAGIPCIVGNRELPKNEIESGEGVNVIRSEVIRFFAYGGNEESPVSGSIIPLHGAWISGELNLMHASIPYALYFRNCHFAASVVMQYAECAALYLDGSHLAHGLHADGLTTKGAVYLREGFSAEGEVRLLGAIIGGDLDCNSGKFHNPGKYALAADGLTTKGSVSLRDSFSAEGVVRLVGANIGGNLSCANGEFHNLGGYALHADGLTTKGDVHLSLGFFAKGVVRLSGANIGGDLLCVGGKFYNPQKYALVVDNLTTKGDVSLSEKFSAEGMVRLFSANIGGNLFCMGGKFQNPKGHALVADRLTTKGNVHLNREFSAKGEVRFSGANIGRNLSCANGEFHNPDGDALVADRLTTKGDVTLIENFSAKGAVRLPGANIGGNFSCTGGKFHNPKGHALVADRLTTKGEVNFRNGFSAEGEVRLPSANIGGNLSCVGGEFYNPDRCALNVQGSNISGNLLWRKTTCEGGVDLTYARADVLADDSKSWESCNVALDGFTYNRFRFVDPMNARFRINWLAKYPDGIKFSPLPYEQAAKVLFGMGHVQDAREILLAKERRQTKYGKMRWLRTVGRRLWDVFAGYGYRLRYTARWMMGIVAFGAVIFGAADWHSNIVPTHPVVALSKEYKMQVGPNCGMRPTQAVPSEYPAFNPIMFSVDVFTPSAVFHQEDSWGPRSGGGDWKDFDFDILWLLTLWYWLEVAMGWILISMLLLSVTGLLRPRQSSGERD